jgi:hypothetical protein
LIQGGTKGGKKSASCELNCLLKEMRSSVQKCLRDRVSFSYFYAMAVDAIAPFSLL